MEQTRTRKKLIEVALPLDKINAASAREKSIVTATPARFTSGGRGARWPRRGRYSSPNWSTTPRSAGRVPHRGRAEKRSGTRLFKIIEDLVLWENTTNERVLEKARPEIRASWRRTCADNRNHPRAPNCSTPIDCPPSTTPSPAAGLSLWRRNG